MSHATADVDPFLRAFGTSFIKAKVVLQTLMLVSGRKALNRPHHVGASVAFVVLGLEHELLSERFLLDLVFVDLDVLIHQPTLVYDGQLVLL